MLFFHFKMSLLENRSSELHMVKYVIVLQSHTKFQLNRFSRSRVITFQSLGTFFQKIAKILKRAIPRLNGSTSCHKIWHGQMYDKNRVACQILGSQPIQKQRYECSKLDPFFGGKIEKYKKINFSPKRQMPST